MTTAIVTDIKSMTSLEVAELTGKQHSNVMRDIRNILEALEDSNQFNFELVKYTDAKGESRPCYKLTKKDCLLLASGYDTNLRAKIINRWEELELANMRNKVILPDFTNPIEAARAWADSEEKRMIETKRADIAERHVEILTHTNKTYTASEVAKECGFRSANALNSWLVAQKVQYKVNNTWVPTADYANRAWFEIKQEELDNGKIIYHRKITGLGRDAIVSMVKKELAENGKRIIRF